MNSPFDTVAPDYQHLWSDTGRGRSQRSEVWRHIDPLFRQGDRVLDIGCGTGDDALHLCGFGVRVVGLDSSPRMVQIARTRGVHARLMPLEDLSRLKSSYAGAISNFGALNCVRDLRPVAEDLSRVIRPGGPLAICLMGKFALVEILRFIARLEWQRAARRWSGRTTWRGLDIYYHAWRQVQKDFAPTFVMHKRVPIGWGDHQLFIFRRKA
ncbi:MAG: class I SAM-dependent methyltransferase [Bryobacterales bacterium]|nr:class I SAM-dependent methyltransferase [Bryobacterales bacterium]MBV9398244.1 class I SAM-dependent methyltransferase [Bryobacterales bacterium]